MGRGKERVAEMKLISGRQKQTAHVNRKQISAVTAPNRDGLEQTCTRNAHLKLIHTTATTTATTKSSKTIIKKTLEIGQYLVN